MQLACDSWLENTLTKTIKDRLREQKLNFEETNRLTDRRKYISRFIDDPALQWEIKHPELSFYLGESFKEIYQQQSIISLSQIQAVCEELRRSLEEQAMQIEGKKSRKRKDMYYETYEPYRDIFSILMQYLGRVPNEKEIEMVTLLCEISLVQQAISLRQLSVPFAPSVAPNFLQICQHLREHKPEYRKKFLYRKHLNASYTRPRLAMRPFAVLGPDPEADSLDTGDWVSQDPIPTPPEKRHARLVAKRLKSQIKMAPKNLDKILQSVPLNQSM